MCNSLCARAPRERGKRGVVSPAVALGIALDDMLLTHKPKGTAGAIEGAGAAGEIVLAGIVRRPAAVHWGGRDPIQNASRSHPARFMEPPPLRALCAAH
jgi:hypothetical protein